jgi:hypothetical protein
MSGFLLHPCSLTPGCMGVAWVLHQRLRTEFQGGKVVGDFFTKLQDGVVVLVVKPVEHHHIAGQYGIIENFKQ